jgi:hypothetical protein
LFAATLLFLGYVSSTQLVQRETFAKKGSSKAPFGFAWKLALALHVLSWFMQIKVGHIEFEDDGQPCYFLPVRLGASLL